jgi:hypothetical protein
LDLCLLDFADGREEFNQIFVAGRPRELSRLSVDYSGGGVSTRKAHVADVDGLRSLGARGSVVCERIGWHRCSTRAGLKIGTASVSSAAAKAKATTAAAAAPTKSSPIVATAAAKSSASASEATSTISGGSSHSGIGETIFANFEETTLPIMTVKLLNRVPSVLGGFKNHDARALGAPVLAKEHIGTDDTAGSSCLWSTGAAIAQYTEKLTGVAEQVLEILPANSVR